MRLSSTVLVDGNPIHFASWKTGYPPGSAVQTFELEPLEPATVYNPAEITTPHPVAISVKVNGNDLNVLKNGHIDAAQDGLSKEGHVNQLSGRDDSQKLLEQGPRRDTAFVPRSIIEEYYPRGVRVRTLAGESVLGLPPGVSPRLYGPYPSGMRTSKGIPGKGAIGGTGGVVGAGFGAQLAGQIYQIVSETEFVADDSDACTDDNRFGTSEEWINTVPPLIIIIGGGQHMLTSSGSGSGASSSGTFGGKGYGGANGASVNGLIKLIAKKAGFTDVVVNTPDLGLFEPLTVSAGSTWMDAIHALVGPWNPMVFVAANVLYIIDIEAANIARSISLGGVP